MHGGVLRTKLRHQIQGFHVHHLGAKCVRGRTQCWTRAVCQEWQSSEPHSWEQGSHRSAVALTHTATPQSTLTHGTYRRYTWKISRSHSKYVPSATILVVSSCQGTTSNNVRLLYNLSAAQEMLDHAKRLRPGRNGPGSNLQPVYPCTPPPTP
jgi:hypothetical protein